MRRTSKTILIVAFAAAAAAAIAQAQPQSGIVRPDSEPAKPSVALGAELFAGNCASCHGINGGGIRRSRPGAGDIMGQGPSLRGVGALAADFYLRRGQMPLASAHDEPADGRVLFNDKEIRSLVQYVASLRSGPAIPTPDPSKGDIADGFHDFTEHCAGCHQIAAAGGYVPSARVPPLQDISATQIAEAVRIGPYLMPQFSKRQISDSDLNSIIAYVLHTNHDDNRGGWGIGNVGPIPEGLVTWWIAVPLLLLACVAIARRMKRE